MPRTLTPRCRVLAAVLLAAVIVADASASDHRYDQGDSVPFYVNKVGPFSNPSETHKFFDLPFCQPGTINEKHQALGEVLNGDRMVQAPYRLNFRVDHERTTLCKRTLSVKDVQKFREAVLNDYYFQMYYDDLPIWGFIGKVDIKSPFSVTYIDTYDKNQQISIFTHIHFEIEYNHDRVVGIYVATDADVMVVVDNSEDKEMEVEFTYSVSWSQTDKAFEKRMDRYMRYTFLPQTMEVHWFSILNSCFTVLLLGGFLATRLRHVLGDLIRYSHDADPLEETEEAGWKSIHGDVFRFPKNKELFCAVLGSGTQLLFLVLFMFILTLVGVLYPFNNGGWWTALVVIYALTSGIAGYTSASFYKQMEGTNWAHSIVLTGCVFGGPAVISFCFLNTVAAVNNSTNAKPLTTILTLTLIWALIACPLLVAGGIAGKRSNAAECQAPCRHSQTSNYPRAIPVLPWYHHAAPQMAMAGFLPFSAIFFELYYICADWWGYKVYTIYSILFIVFINFIIVTALMAIALTYYHLAAEDHEWWWRSVLCSGSPALFIFGYCCYYYHAQSHMTGFMQASFFFACMACVCYGLFLMLATVGFCASLALVRRLYRSIGHEFTGSAGTEGATLPLLPSGGLVGASVEVSGSSGIGESCLSLGARGGSAAAQATVTGARGGSAAAQGTVAGTRGGSAAAHGTVARHGVHDGQAGRTPSRAPGADSLRLRAEKTSRATRARDRTKIATRPRRATWKTVAEA